MGVPIFEIEQIGATVVVAPRRNVTNLADDDVKNEMAGLLEQIVSSNIHGIVFDFGQVDYCGSCMLEAMRRLWKSLPADKAKLFVCGVNPVVRDILRVTRFDTIWPIHPNREAAIRAAEA
jgi:anti-anti-sigma factor